MSDRPLRVLDPAVGHGELLVSLLNQLTDWPKLTIEVYGFETAPDALDAAAIRISQRFPSVSLHFESRNFLEYVIECAQDDGQMSLFPGRTSTAYDLIIANPPYVRTQIIGAKQSQLLAERFDLSGRVDLYHAFILGMSKVLTPEGIAGIIVSNRFMTTKAGARVRKTLLEHLNLRHAWDLGDTKLFDAAVLPAVLLVAGKKNHKSNTPAFTTIYQTTKAPVQHAANPIAALDLDGVVEIDDGRCFRVQHGKLGTNGSPDGVWRIANKAVDTWLANVEAHSYCNFGDIGKVRVGVKTCADKVFIRNDWEDMDELDQPELLKPLITHHIARRFKSFIFQPQTKIIYPHQTTEGRRHAIDLTRFPRSRSYLEAHRTTLEKRQYLIDAGREWYEIWVPQDPDCWSQPKLVFRDIANEPAFWIDLDGAVVNGDCYFLICQDPSETDLLWLAAAVGNSTFVECYYDHNFHNKLYAGRRRFMTQYVSQFPLPDPRSSVGKELISKAKLVYKHISSPRAKHLQEELNSLVWEAFDLVEEVSW